ncbi:MAG: RsmD family RNA methyltransferase [Propionibacteriaceae bacterium]|jgi:16S rRNA (guanine966-N2)-methyltransferase|nr:RsmD family RNA methyltransferase [Propionibacteriaceae bacterium]
MTRIVAGRWASRRLTTLAGSSTRPTSERVREAVFNHLAVRLGRGAVAPAEQLAGVSLIDLFAGSGAIGFEAASRGADPVAWVERQPAAARVIEQNKRQLGASGRLYRAEVGHFVRTAAAQPFTVVWLDPPYSLPTAEVDQLVTALRHHGWLAEAGLLVLERSRSAVRPDLSNFTDTWSRDYGDTCVYSAR